MKNKYFIPDIEDLHIGYELEINYNFKLNDIFHKKIIDSFEKLSDIHSRISGDCVIRVPYLTKEQIEAEGWELIQIYPKGACIFQKGTKEEGCELTCDFTEHRVHFTKLYFYGLDDEYTRTKLTWRSLECKDINTFRKIIKLLEI